MINSEFKDADGFRLQFDEAVPDAERKYYMKTFPRVDDVSKDRIHCTTCDCHVGTAPISEKIIRTHQILSVTQCNKCFAFYNSGEFGKGEDGSEYYCRWCGQGGEVFCCATCPFVFCNKCIKDNLTDRYVKEIEENDDWSCFVCNKEILKRLRGQHWALRNFMNKQLEKIQKVNINSEEELNNLLNDDLTSCCPKKKRKLPLPKPVPAPIKRPLTNGSHITMAQPPAKRPTLTPPNKQIKIPVHPSFHQPKPGPRSMTPKRQNEVVCTPDIMGLFNEQGGSSKTAPPPPLAMRQIQRPLGPRSAVPNPIYHTVNGYQIDLNQASRQEIFRLPNGKLIQVRKQSNPTPTTPRLSVPAVPSTPLATPITGIMPRGTQFSIRPTSAIPNMTTQSRMMRPQANAMPRIRGPSNQRFSFSDGRVVSGGGTSSSSNTPTANASTLFTQQNGSISVARAPQPDTPFGKSKTAFEDRVIQGLEICQHTINKMITLTNSTSFKTSRSFADLKDLYIHLQYLFTYTSGKFKTLQDNLVTGMEELAKYDAALREKNGDDDDDLEIMQQKVDIIEVLSDDDEPPVSKVIKTESNTDARVATPKSDEKEVTVEVQPDLPTALLETILDTIPTTVNQTVFDPEELLASLNLEVDDIKLKKRTAVKVERLEDSKNSVIKQYLIAIQQRRDAELEDDVESDSGSAEREKSPDMLIPEVVLEEKQNEESEEESSKAIGPKCSKEKVDDKSEEMQLECKKALEENKSNDKPEEAEDESIDKTEDKSPIESADKPENTLIPSNDKLENNPTTEKSAEVVEIQSDDEEQQKSPQESHSEALEDVTIDSTLPADLMEVDESLKETTDNVEDSVMEVNETVEDSVMEVTEIIDESVEEIPENVNEETNGVGNPENVEESAQNLSEEIIAISSSESVIAVEPSQSENQLENDTSHCENGTTENTENSHEELVKKVVENQSPTIEDESDLLDTLINSLDDPLASIDVDIPESMD